MGLRRSQARNVGVARPQLGRASAGDARNVGVARPQPAPTPKPAAARRSVRFGGGEVQDGAAEPPSKQPPPSQAARRSSRTSNAAATDRSTDSGTAKRKSQRSAGAAKDGGAKRAKSEGAATGSEGGASGARDARCSSDSDSDSDIDLSTARPKVGAAVTVKRLGEKPPGSKRRKNAQWLPGTVKSTDERTQHMVVALQSGGEVKRKWDAKDVRFDNEEEDVQRPDLDAVDDRAIRLKDALRASIQIWRHSNKFRCFHQWVAKVAAIKQQNAASARGTKAPSPPQLHSEAPAKRPARKKLQQPGRTGLRNLGNTCYMSSVVQSLSAIPAFRQLFVQLPEHIGMTPAPAGSPSPTAVLPLEDSLVRTSTVALVKDMQKGQSGRRRASDGGENLTARQKARKKMLSWQLSDLLRVLWSGKILMATPHRLLAAVYTHGPRFSGFEQQDAQDFLYFLLERASEELKEEGLGDEQLQQLDSLFKGTLQSTLSCPNCSHRSVRPEDFTDLSLDFPPKPEGGAGRARTLFDCLAHFTSAEEIEMRCEKCGKMGNFKKRLQILKHPPVLVLHLKRWRTTIKTSRSGEISLVRQKDNSKIAVEELLDILPYRVGAQTTKPDRDEHAQEPTEEDPVDADDELEQKPGLRRTRSASAPATEGAAVPGRRKHTGGRGTKPPQKLDESDARKGNRARSTSRGGVKKIKLAPAAASATPSPVLRSDAAPIAPLQPSAASNCCIYRLRAAIIHHGSGVGKGHYTAFARPGPAANRGLPGGEVASSVRAEGPGSEEEWVEYNDVTLRSDVRVDEVLHSNPYMLIFELQPTPSQQNSPSDERLVVPPPKS